MKHAIAHPTRNREEQNDEDWKMSSRPYAERCRNKDQSPRDVKDEVLTVRPD
jgi:hypothetical protein